MNITEIVYLISIGFIDELSTPVCPYTSIYVNNHYRHHYHYDHCNIEKRYVDHYRSSEEVLASYLDRSRLIVTLRPLSRSLRILFLNTSFTLI